MKIGIIGSGNVAFHLAQGLKDANHEISYIMGRNEIIGRDLAQRVSTDFFLSLPDISVDWVIVCVNDDSILSVIQQFPLEQKIAYTSGTVELNSILAQTKHTVGVFYPLQSFSRDRSVNLFEVPFLIEAKDDEDAKSLFDLAWSISRKVQYCSSEQRKHYHVAAVMVNNFTNHLFHLGKKHVEAHDLDFEVLYPLIQETVQKAMDLSPYAAQTGPARRNDQQTIQEHLNMLDGTDKEIYRIITNSILTNYQK